MTPRSEARAVGLDGMAEVMDSTGQSLQQLLDCHRDTPQLFRIILLGCLYEKNKKDENRRKKIKIHMK